MQKQLALEWLWFLGSLVVGLTVVPLVLWWVQPPIIYPSWWKPQSATSELLRFLSIFYRGVVDGAYWPFPAIALDFTVPIWTLVLAPYVVGLFVRLTRQAWQTVMA